MCDASDYSAVCIAIPRDSDSRWPHSMGAPVVSDQIETQTEMPGCVARVLFRAPRRLLAPTSILQCSLDLLKGCVEGRIGSACGRSGGKRPARGNYSPVKDPGEGLTCFGCARRGLRPSRLLRPG
jgi:hypothetical protein